MLGLVASILQLVVASSPGVTTLSSEAEIIGASLGKKVTVERSLSRDLVFVSGGRLQGMDLLKTVSLAVHGSVVATEDGFRIERTKTDREELQKLRLAIRTKWIDDHIARLRAFRSSKLKGQSLLSVYTAERNREQEAFRRFSNRQGPYPETYFAEELLPSETLLESLVEKVGAKRFAGVPIGGTEIFEDFPVDGAQPLPKHEDLVDAYVRESAQLENETLPPATDAHAKYFGKPSLHPAKLRLKIVSGPSAVLFSLEGYDANGGQVAAAEFSTLAHNPNEAPGTVAEEGMADPHAEWTPVRESAEAFLTSMGKIGSEAPAWLLKPDKIEPLNLFASDALNGMAAQDPGRTTVVDVSDTFWYLAKMVDRRGQMCVSAFEKILDQCYDYERIVNQGAVIWRPKDPSAEESSTADRKVLAQTTRRLVAGTGDLLREISLGYHETSPQFDPLVELWFNYTLRLTDLGNFQLPTEPVCRLLGAISGGDWDELVSGRTLALSSVVKGDELWNALADDFVPPGGRPIESDIQQHSIELFDRSTIGETRLSLTTQKSLVVRSWLQSENRKWWGDVSMLANLGPEHAVTLHKPREEWGREEFEVFMGGGRLFRYATAVDRIAVLSLPYGFHSDFRCRVAYTNVSEPVLFTDLPKEIQDEAVHEALRQWAAAWASMKPTQPALPSGSPGRP